jgi:amidophosphoribosyltransferase
MLREAGAREVHLRISSPPYKWPCFYGMDTGTRGELLAANLTVDEIRDYVDADTISYLTLDRLLEATGAVNAGFCDACLTGEYPIEVPVNLRKAVLEVDAVERDENGTPIRREPAAGSQAFATGDSLFPADDAAARRA